jgi:hypothetical protein
MLVGLRAYNQHSVNPGRAGEIDLATATVSPLASRSREAGFTGALRPYPCLQSDVRCIVEEWTFF